MKILIAEDDKITRSLLVRWVKRWGYEVVVAEDGMEAMQLLHSDLSIQLCVLDWMMPGMSGPEICRQLRSERHEPYVYTTLLTSKTETDDVVEGLKSGADDYIQKPCHPLELEVRLRVGRRLVELQGNLIEAREKLRFEASHDHLTRLLNRGAIVEELGRKLDRGRQLNQPVTVMMVDVDHFKAINDTYGHGTGDVVLREVADRINGELRRGDIAGRYGGEEFMIILEDCNLGYGMERAEELRISLSKNHVHSGPLAIPVHASFGVASTSQSHRADTELLMRASDAALYRSKGAGRNCVSPAEIKEFDRPSMRSSGTVPTSAA